MKKIFIFLFTAILFLPYSAYATEYHISPSGDDSNNGTSLETAWKTLRHAVRSGTEVTAGDTVYLHAGTYYNYPVTDYSGSIANRVYCTGSAGNPVTIKNYNNEVVVIENGYPEFRTGSVQTPNTDWEVVDADKSIYRSVNTFASPGSSGLNGTLGSDNQDYMLINYADSQDFNSTNQVYTTTDATGIYCGPGVLWQNIDGGHIYIRTQKSDKEVAMGYNIPALSDPRQFGMTLFPYHWLLYIQGTAHHINFEGLIFKNCSIVCEITTGAHDINFTNCTITGNKYGIIIKPGVDHVVIDGLSRTMKYPDWIAMSDVKLGLTPMANMKGVGIDIQGTNTGTATNNIEVKNCSLDGGWACMYLGLSANAGDCHDIKVHHNTITRYRDGAIPIGSSFYNVEIDHNKITRSFEGVSFYDSGTCTVRGTTYIHHNVIDTRDETFGGRSDPNNLLGDYYDEGDGRNNGDGMITERPFGMHTDNSNAWGAEGSPWKVYNNTCLSGRDGNEPNNMGVGITYRMEPFNSNVKHEVYNNIFMMYGDGNLLYAARYGDGSQIYDGNIYYRIATNPTNDFFSSFESTYQTADTNYSSLAAFKASAEFTTTQGYYTPGWEASGREGNPQLDATYHPTLTSIANYGGVDISAKGWPGCTDTFIGAFPAYRILIMKGR